MIIRAAALGRFRSLRPPKLPASSGFPEARLASTVTRISLHPPRVLTIAPSLYNSLFPAAPRTPAAANSEPSAHSFARFPWTAHTRRTDWSLSSIPHNSFRLALAASNDQVLAARHANRHAPALTRCLPIPAHASNGTTPRLHAAQT